MTDELTKQITLLEKLLKKEENKFCIDCRRKSPSWASITHGIFMCIKCAGFHRELGVHISKVKSINLDKWPKGVAEKFIKISNDIANSFWESKLKDEDFERLRNDDYRLLNFIKDKYERKRWAKKGVDPMTLIYEGKDPQTIMEIESGEKLEKDKQTIKVNTMTLKKPLVTFVGKTNNEKANSSNELKANFSQGNNASLIDFSTNVETNHTKNNSNVNDIHNLLFSQNNTTSDTGNSADVGTKQQSSFSFINKSNVSSFTTQQINGSSLINPDSQDNHKANQIKNLTDSLSNVYKDTNNTINVSNDQLKNNLGRSNSYIQLNQPSINISNTYYNYGGLNQNQIPRQNPNQNISQNPNSNANLYFNNSMNPYDMNRMPMQTNVPHMTNNPYNEGRINYNMVAMDLGLDLPSKKNQTNDFNLNLNYNQNINVTKKKEEDPFKGLVSFK